MTPIDALLSSIEWVENPPYWAEPSDLPTSTHSGVLEVAGMRLRCYRLSDGRAVIDADDLKDWIEGALGGES